MGEVDDAGGERRDAAGVIAVLRADHDELDRLRRELRDVGDQPRDVVDRALALGNQHAAARDDDQVVDGDGPFRGIDLFVRVDVVGEPGDAGEIDSREAAQADVAGAHGILRGPGRGRQRDERGGGDASERQGHVVIVGSSSATSNSRTLRLPALVA